jgi:hypothetical protein
VPGEWGTLRLGDVCSKIGSGATPRGGSGVYLDHGRIALIRSQNVRNQGFNRDGLAFITEAHAEELDHVLRRLKPDTRSLIKKKLSEYSIQIARDTGAGLVGIDYIVDENVEVIGIEVNIGRIGGLTSAAKIRNTTAQRLEPFVRFINFLLKGWDKNLKLVPRSEVSERIIAEEWHASKPKTLLDLLWLVAATSDPELLDEPVFESDPDDLKRLSLIKTWADIYQTEIPRYRLVDLLHILEQVYELNELSDDAIQIGNDCLDSFL